uniref:Uncharacterized protein TCIL3000_4_560 n=1 Tax=Trypanosoma congolense (strain IL3000) TaxID=1068625 RepID=G0UKR9_TRYCI|nr:unnamed protein product [Trypanosoma congolense IL3000]
MLPDPLAFKALEEESDRYCRLHHTALHPRLVDVRTQMQEEVCTAYGVIAENNLVPSPSYFRWAVDIILSRSHQLPLCWRSACGNGIELGVLPFIDLINGDDGVSRKRNARVEVAFEVGELPRWYLDEFLRESERRGTDGEGELRRLLDDHFFALVSLERDLAASEEVIMTYELPQWSAGTLKSEDELRLGRLLRYHF